MRKFEVRREVIIQESFSRLIILEMAVPVCPIECRAPQSPLSELRIIQLQVILDVIVSFIVIISDIAVSIIIFTCGIVPPVPGIRVQVYSFPCYARMLLSVEPSGTKRVLPVHPAENGKSRLDISKRIADIPFSDALGKGKIKIDSAPCKPGPGSSRRRKRII